MPLLTPTWVGSVRRLRVQTQFVLRILIVLMMKMFIGIWEARSSRLRKFRLLCAAVVSKLSPLSQHHLLSAWTIGSLNRAWKSSHQKLVSREQLQHELMSARKPVNQ